MNISDAILAKRDRDAFDGGFEAGKDYANERIAALTQQLADTRAALKKSRRWLAFRHEIHVSHCAFCNGGGACDCPLPAIDTALAPIQPAAGDAGKVGQS